MEAEALTKKVQQAVESAKSSLLNEMNTEGYWMGMLSSSAVSTAIGLMTLTSIDRVKFRDKINKGTLWLSRDQNKDGGWGDSDRSPSNFPTTILSVSALSMIDTEKYAGQIKSGKKFIDAHGGFQGITDYYGDDRTFSVPIKTVAALAGLINWKDVPVLPYEAVLLPRSFLRALRVPIVSYAVPALCAIGMLGQKKNPASGFRGYLRKKAEKKAFKLLKELQPDSGGYLEAAPLTGFVTTALSHLGQNEFEVTKNALKFILQSQREDGSWPIDENLSVWNTAIAIQTLDSCGMNVSQPMFKATRNWYMHRQVGTHIFTESPPGGFAWTHLSGGVPDGDDTAAALVVLNLFGIKPGDSTIQNAVSWCKKIQNRNGGWPTFCRGWEKLPFDKSSVDITAHILIGLKKAGVTEDSKMFRNGIQYLLNEQLKDGSWHALWFGNELEADKQNYTYATSQAIKALVQVQPKREITQAIERGTEWLVKNQNQDGGWGPVKGIDSSPEETSFGVMGLLEAKTDPMNDCIKKGIKYLLKTQDSNSVWESRPIGLYFAQLWYYEKIYGMAFPLWALSLWLDRSGSQVTN